MQLLHALQLLAEIAKSHDWSGEEEGQTHRCRSQIQLWPIVTSAQLWGQILLLSAPRNTKSIHSHSIANNDSVLSAPFNILSWKGPFQTLWWILWGWRYDDSWVPEEAGVAVIVSWRPALLSPVNVSGQKNPAETGWHFTEGPQDTTTKYKYKYSQQYYQRQRQIQICQDNFDLFLAVWDQETNIKYRTVISNTRKTHRDRMTFCRPTQRYLIHHSKVQTILFFKVL